VSAYRALAPAKVNLGLFVGAARERDGRHEIASVMQSISLSDELILRPAPDGAGTDVVLCPALEGEQAENLAARAMRAFRSATGWDGPPQLLEIDKRIPLAAGLGGGSADAAAALRLLQLASGLGNEEMLRAIGAELGADVPAQIAPGRWLAAGAGERLERLPAAAYSFTLLVLPDEGKLSTADVYAEADRGHVPSNGILEERLADMRSAFSQGAALPAARELLHNDLQRAAVSMRPEIAATLEALRRAGAWDSFVSGSGPTVVAAFAGAPSSAQNEQAAMTVLERLGERTPPGILAGPVTEDFASPHPLGGSQP
jgi:4-diphosphocytidyl-2-C-methyl-D-erythritol kinase